ncbi:hypothetical protein Glove_284g119 [Diversispora epigaea]|uniref:Uncharacterized protein n=1 Tax=Diversispora epigaea TaxID=1348612 RepID=A0A397I512_9GLOM|nr:hypothetical protein Glove_284g119 [Diversispora epigaea]
MQYIDTVLPLKVRVSKFSCIRTQQCHMLYTNTVKVSPINIESITKIQQKIHHIVKKKRIKAIGKDITRAIGKITTTKIGDMIPTQTTIRHMAKITIIQSQKFHI